MKLAPLVLALASLVLPAAAAASTASLENGELRLISAPGEATDLRVRVYQDPSFGNCAGRGEVSCVLGAGVQPGPGCQASDLVPGVVCSGAVAAVVGTFADGTDKVDVEAGAKVVRLDGGAGDDELQVAEAHDVTVLGGDGDDAVTVKAPQDVAVPVLVDGGAGNDRLAADIAQLTRGMRLIGGPGDDAIVARDYLKVPSPRDAVLVDCGEGRDTVNDEVYSSYVNPRTPTRVSTGLTFAAADCPPTPTTLPGKRTVPLLSGDRIRVPLSFPEAVTVRLTLRTGLVRRILVPQSVTTRMPAGATRATVRIPAKTLAALRRYSVPRYGRRDVPLAVEIAATDAQGERWTLRDEDRGGGLSQPNLRVLLPRR